MYHIIHFGVINHRVKFCACQKWVIQLVRAKHTQKYAWAYLSEIWYVVQNIVSEVQHHLKCEDNGMNIRTMMVMICMITYLVYKLSYPPEFNPTVHFDECIWSKASMQFHTGVFMRIWVGLEGWVTLYMYRVSYYDMYWESVFTFILRSLSLSLLFFFFFFLYRGMDCIVINSYSSSTKWHRFSKIQRTSNTFVLLMNEQK